MLRSEAVWAGCAPSSHHHSSCSLELIFLTRLPSGFPLAGPGGHSQGLLCPFLAGSGSNVVVLLLVVLSGPASLPLRRCGVVKGRSRSYLLRNRIMPQPCCPKQGARVSDGTEFGTVAAAPIWRAIEVESASPDATPVGASRELQQPRGCCQCSDVECLGCRKDEVACCLCIALFPGAGRRIVSWIEVVYCWLAARRLQQQGCNRLMSARAGVSTGP